MFWGVLGAGIEPCFHQYRTWSCFSMYYGAFNEVDGCSDCWQSWWQSPMLFCDRSDVVVEQQFKSSLKELLSSGFEFPRMRILSGPHLYKLSSSGLIWYDIQSSRAPLSRWTYQLTWEATCPPVIGRRIKIIIFLINCPISLPFSSEELIGEDKYLWEVWRSSELWRMSYFEARFSKSGHAQWFRLFWWNKCGVLNFLTSNRLWRTLVPGRYLLEVRAYPFPLS